MKSRLILLAICALIFSLIAINGAYGDDSDSNNEDNTSNIVNEDTDVLKDLDDEVDDDVEDPANVNDSENIEPTKEVESVEDVNTDQPNGGQNILDISASSLNVSRSRAMGKYQYDDFLGGLDFNTFGGDPAYNYGKLAQHTNTVKQTYIKHSMW